MLDRYFGRKTPLEDMDWTLTHQRDSRTKDLTHGIHVYPARLVPEIARRIIDRFTERSGVVLDPFCGSGGVPLEAMVRGRSCIGLDLNPLAILISQVKTTSLDPKILHTTLRAIKNQIEQSPETNGDVSGTLQTINLDHWFPSNVIDPLLQIRTEITGIEHIQLRRFFRVMLSETIRKVSFARKNEYKLYRMSIEVREGFKPNALKVFFETSKAAINAMSKLWHLTQRLRTSLPAFIKTDSRTIPLLDNIIDLVLTSPPYGDSATTVGYGQFSKLSMAWLGFDGKEGSAVDSRGLGGRRVDSRNAASISDTLRQSLQEISEREADLKTKRVPIVASFFEDYLLTLREMARVCKVDGICCIVIGNRSVRGFRLPTDLITIELAGKCGFSHMQTMFRSIPLKRHPVTQKLYVDPKWVEAKRKRKPETVMNIVKESIILLRRNMST